MKLGFQPIDDDHGSVLALVAEVESLIEKHAGAGEVEPLFLRMMDTTVAHFRQEERWMARFGYPGLAVHRREHEEVTAWLLHVHDALTAENAEALSEETGAAALSLFRAWVDQHLRQLDQPAVKYIQRASGESIQP